MTLRPFCQCMASGLSVQEPASGGPCHESWVAIVSTTCNGRNPLNFSVIPLLTDKDTAHALT